MPTFTASCAAYLKLPGESATDFAKQLKSLTYQDKLDLWEAFGLAGLECQKPMDPAAK